MCDVESCDSMTFTRPRNRAGWLRVLFAALGLAAILVLSSHAVHHPDEASHHSECAACWHGGSMPDPEVPPWISVSIPFVDSPLSVSYPATRSSQRAHSTSRLRLAGPRSPPPNHIAGIPLPCAAWRGFALPRPGAPSIIGESYHPALQKRPSRWLHAHRAAHRRGDYRHPCGHRRSELP